MQMSVYNFEKADVEKTWKHFEFYEGESQALISQFNAMLADKNAGSSEKQRFPLLAAYELCLKCSHLFNLLDARGALSALERVGVIPRIRMLECGWARTYSTRIN